MSRRSEARRPRLVASGAAGSVPMSFAATPGATGTARTPTLNLPAGSSDSRRLRGGSPSSVNQGSPMETSLTNTNTPNPANTIMYMPTGDIYTNDAGRHFVKIGNICSDALLTNKVTENTGDVDDSGAIDRMSEVKNRNIYLPNQDRPTDDVNWTAYRLSAVLRVNQSERMTGILHEIGNIITNRNTAIQQREAAANCLPY